jgi:multiple sugar transport system permease protein
MTSDPVRATQRPARRDRGPTTRRRFLTDSWFPFLAPTIVVFLLITIIPLIYALTLSLHAWRLGTPQPWTFVGLQNFRQIFTIDPYFWTTARVTAIYISVSVAAQLVVGMAVALLLNRQFFGVGVLRTLFLIPTMMTPVVVGVTWRIMYNPDLGFINQLLRYLGFDAINWLGSAAIALWAVIAVEVWQWTPFIALIILAGLRSLPSDPFEAARIDGANAWQMFVHIVLPLMKPFVMVALLVRTMDAFKAYDLVFILTQGGPGLSTEILSFYAYRTGFNFFQMGYASALSLLLLFSAVFVSQVIVRLLRKEDQL